MRVVAYVDEAVGEELVARAAAESRSVSQMAGLLLDAALGGLPAAAVSPRPAQAVDVSGSGKSPLAEKQAAREGNQRPGGNAEPVPGPPTAVDLLAIPGVSLGMPAGSSPQGPPSVYEPEDEEPRYPYLPSAQRYATAQDFADPNFDPADFQ